MGAEADPQRAGDATGDDMEARLRGLDEHIDEAKGKQREAAERADPDAVAGNFQAESEGAQQSRDASEFDL